MLAQRLAEWLAQTSDQSSLAGCSVLELGSIGAGTGLAGLAAWRAGAKRVCLSDSSENVPRLQRKLRSAAIDGKPASIKVVELDWTAPLSLTMAAKRFDLILAADCVYRHELIAPLLSTLRALAGKDRHQRVLLATAADRGSSTEAFLTAAHAAGWAVTRQEWPGAHTFPQGSIEVLRHRQCELHELRCGARA